MNIRPMTWWIAFCALLAAAIGLPALLAAQGHDAAAGLVFILTNALNVLWLAYGLIHWRDHPIVRRIGMVVAFTVAAQLVVSVFFVLGAPDGVIAVTGIWAMGVLFYVGMLLVRLVFTPGHPVLGVARTLVDEAMHMKVPLIFLIILLLIVPVLPFVLTQDQLRYRVQTFLTWSLTATGLLLSLMTIFLAIGSITGEVQHRQIFLTMTKPVSRAGYLLGKWLGLGALNLVLLGVCAVGIFAFTMILAGQPTDATDAWVLREQVLVARETLRPSPANVDLRELYTQHLTRLRSTDPGMYGPPGSPQDALPAPLRIGIQNQILTELFVVPPRGVRAFRFAGLGGQDIGETVQLRLKPRPASPSPDGTVLLFLRLNGYPHPENPISLVESQYHMLDLPAPLIQAGGGELLLEIANPGRPHPSGDFIPQPSITFDVKDSIEVLYRVGGFEGNFVRSIVMMWVRLAFLAMLGIAAGAYLSFPIASLLALMVYFAAVGSGFISESLDAYGGFSAGNAGGWEWISGFTGQFIASVGTGDLGTAVKMIIRMMGSGFMALVPAFGDYNPTPLLADGRWVSPTMLAHAVLRVGLLWTGVVGFVAWLLWRRRELAKVTV